MKIALAGASGNFGKMAMGLLASHGHEVTAIHRDQWESSELSGFDVCFLSIPVTEIEKYLDNCKDCTVVEISSVKEPVKKFKGQLISIHPIFGPRSIEVPSFRNIIYVEDLSMEGGKEVVEELFPGFSLFCMTADEHDEAMVEILVKPFLMSRIASDISGPDSGVLGPSQKILNQLARISNSESSGILMDTIRLNPKAKRAIDEILEASRKLEKELAE